MDWGEIFGHAITGAGGFVLMTKWMEIENPSTLRYTIRSDIRNFNRNTIESWLRAIDGAIHNYVAMDQRGLRDQATMMKELLIEEAEGLGIL